MPDDDSGVETGRILFAVPGFNLKSSDQAAAAARGAHPDSICFTSTNR